MMKELRIFLPEKLLSLSLSENQETATFQIDEGKHNWVGCWN
jgi:hypothetical protein